MSTETTKASVSTIQNSGFDVERIRRDFPILDLRIGDHPLVYLDNAATTQKPRVLIDSLNKFYAEQNANIHRGVYFLSEKATDAYEKSRVRIANFINAAAAREIIFLRGTTEAINLVAQSFGRRFFQKDDEVIISILEHHANIVPWQIICELTGAKLKVIPMDDRGVLNLDAYEKMLSDCTRMVAITHISNAIGTVNPVKEMIEKAHQWDVPVLIDGAQSVPHFPIDVSALDCDFFVFSGHKLFGPTGVGVLYGKEKWLREMPPYQGGGEMIRTVTMEKTTFKDIPDKFEAGTPDISGVIGLSVAIDYFESLGIEAIQAHENDLLNYGTEALEQVSGLNIMGNAPDKSNVLSFVLADIHPHDIGTFLDSEGIAVRAGHHCAQPLMKRLGVSATARASLCLYNTREEINKLTANLLKIKKFFS